MTLARFAGQSVTLEFCALRENPEATPSLPGKELGKELQPVGQSLAVRESLPVRAGWAEPRIVRTTGAASGAE